MLSMQHNCQLVFLLLFLVSMLGSIQRSDINSTYSLFGYMFLASNRYRTSLDNVLNMLLIVSIIIALSDIWAFYIMLYEPISAVGHIFAYIVIIAEFVLKVFLIVMITCWRFNKSKPQSHTHQKKTNT